MSGWVQASLYVALCLGLLIVTLLVLRATFRSFQVQWLEMRLRKQLAVKQYSAALTTIEQALKIDAANNFFYLQRAKLHAEIGDYPAAEADFTEGMRFAHGAPAYAGRASVRLALGRPKDALIDANHAIACSRFWWKGYYERGRVYAFLGHYRVALEDFNQALELNRTPPPELQQAHSKAAAQLEEVAL